MMPKRKSAKPAKSSKPYRDFPLTAHPRGQWCKNIRARIHCFGAWPDPDAALGKYLDEWEDLQAGRTPRRHGGMTLAEICNL
jgi:hypothetical protein